MESRKIRDQMVIATKFTTDYKSYEVGKGRSGNVSGNTRRSMHLSVRDSLKKSKPTGSIFFTSTGGIISLQLKN